MSEPPALLRLGLAPGSLGRLRQHPLLSDLRGRSVKADLRLLDTPDRRFAATGWLCLGVEDRAGLRHLRLPVTGDAGIAAPAVEGPLQTLATGSLEGRAVTLERDGQTLLVQGHRVTLEQGTQQVSYEALVLEGAADSARAALHGLAAELGRDLPLRWTGVAPAVQAAVELGLILPPPQRAAAFDSGLSEDLDAAAAFAAIARQCLAQFDANMAPTLLDRDIEGVHQMRVALRRLRSAVGLFADMVDANRLAPLLDDLRWLNAPLGRKRDLDVFIAETLAPLRALSDPPRGLQHLATVLDDRRAAAQQALQSALTAPRVAHFRLQFELFLDAVLDGSAVIAADSAALPLPQFAADLLQRRRRKLRKLGRDYESLDTEALHDLRIRAKKLRYAAEFFRSAFRRRESRRFIAALAELQDCLGALNDADVGGRLIENVLSGPDRDPAAAAITAWFAGRQQLQLAHLGAAWRGFDRIKPFWKDALED
jgi:triphosphatase